MKQSVGITPLNCSFLEGLNTIIYPEEIDYNNTNARALYFRNPKESWFKMKSDNAGFSPYIEPVFFGLKKGDTLTLEFDAMLVSGELKEFGVSLRDMSKGVPDESTYLKYCLPQNSITSYFKRFKIPMIISRNTKNADAVITNIREFTNIKHEVIIRNIEFTIETSNTNFSTKPYYVEYKNEKDYLTSIQTVGGTDIKPIYNTTRIFLDNEQISFTPDETMKIKNSNSSGNFKGLLALFSGSNYNNPAVIYLEYKTNNNADFYAARQDYDNSNLQIGNEQSKAINPTNGQWKKKIFYFKSNSGKRRNVILNVGAVRSDLDIEFRDVIFSFPRFDDELKKQPNNLFELYSDIGGKLR